MSPPVYKRMLRYCCDRLSFLGRELDHNLVTKFLSLLWNKVWDKVRSKTSTSGNAFFFIGPLGTRVLHRCVWAFRAMHCFASRKTVAFHSLVNLESWKQQQAVNLCLRLLIRKWRIWARINHIDLVASQQIGQDKTNQTFTWVTAASNRAINTRLGQGRSLRGSSLRNHSMF